MPFTFSHPAVVLPFIYLPKKYRSSTGLIIGSIAPDFEKFLRMTSYDYFSHTWRSIFYFNLPLAIILAFIYHLIVRNTFIDHLPDFLRKRLNRYKNLNWSNYFRHNYKIIILSIIVGTISHIAWDKITHLNSDYIGWLSSGTFKVKIFNYKIKLLGPLQFATSLIGGLIIIYFINKLPTNEKLSQNKHKAEYWILLFSIMVFIIILKLNILDSPSYLGNIIIITISAGLIGLVISSWLIGRLENKSGTF